MDSVILSFRVLRAILLRLSTSILNTRVVTKSSHMGQDRTDRDMLIFTHAHNCGTDVARGICIQDVYGNRTWVEQEVAGLWTNIDGAIPGGNLMMPPARPADSQWTEVMLKSVRAFFVLC